jgi:hypothetical protein
LPLIAESEVWDEALVAQVRRALEQIGPVLCVTVNDGTKLSFYLRAARFLMRAGSYDWTFDSRLLDHLIPNQHKHIASAAGIGMHPEHVVPCAYLRDKGVELAKSGATENQLLAFLWRCLVVVHIHSELADALDGPLGLRDRMPDKWSWNEGCVYQRLHEVNAPFIAPPGADTCRCG